MPGDVKKMEGKHGVEKKKHEGELKGKKVGRPWTGRELSRDVRVVDDGGW